MADGPYTEGWPRSMELRKGFYKNPGTSISVVPLSDAERMRTRMELISKTLRSAREIGTADHLGSREEFFQLCEELAEAVDPADLNPKEQLGK